MCQTQKAEGEQEAAGTGLTEYRWSKKHLQG